MSNATALGSCLARLRSIINTLTNAERKAAHYILNNSTEVIHMPITELAEAIRTAEATIFRLCKKIGYTGYQDFKIALACDLYTPLESVHKEVDTQDTPTIIAGKIFNGITEGLQDTLQIMNGQALEQAISAIDAAQRIDAYGSGGSAIIAADIEHRFMRFGIPVRAYADPHMQMTSAVLLKPTNVVIAISHSGANRDILDAAQLAKDAQATVISITSYMRSPISKIADISLYGMAREVNYRSEAMASRLIHLALVDVLYVGAMLKKQDTFVDNMQKVRQAIAKRRI